MDDLFHQVQTFFPTVTGFFLREALPVSVQFMVSNEDMTVCWCM